MTSHPLTEEEEEGLFMLGNMPIHMCVYNILYGVINGFLLAKCPMGRNKSLSWQKQSDGSHLKVTAQRLLHLYLIFEKQVQSSCAQMVAVIQDGGGGSGRETKKYPENVFIFVWVQSAANDSRKRGRGKHRSELKSAQHEPIMFNHVLWHKKNIIMYGQIGHSTKFAAATSGRKARSTHDLSQFLKGHGRVNVTEKTAATNLMGQPSSTV